MRYILLLLFAVLSLIEAREEKVGEYQINVYGKNNQLLMAKHYHDQWLEKHIDYIDYYDAEGHLTYLAASEWRLGHTMEQWEGVRFLKSREHS